MTDERLRAENEELRLRLEEAEDAIEAIRTGAVDAIVVREPQGDRVYTLEGADRPYRILVERMQQGAATLDAAGAVVYCNRRFAELVGVPDTKVIGTSLTAFLPESEDAVCAGLLRTGTAGTSEGETRLRRPDGTEFPVYLTVNALPSDSGAAVGVLVTDLTVPARAGEARFRALVEHVRDYAIFMIDRDGRATTWNQGVRRVLGFDEAEFIGLDVRTAIFTPEDVASGAARRELETAAAEGSASDDRWMRRKDGTRFFAFGVTTAVRDPAGGLLGFTKVMRDQTRQKRLEDELRRAARDLSDADRRKDVFLATLAHELRNPLAPIRNALQLMRLSPTDAETIADARQVAERQLDQMVRLVDDLMEVSRITRGKVELKKERAELASILRTAVETSWPLVDAARHELAVDLPEEQLFVHGDPVRLAQVFSNLLNNAAKYTERGGRIRLTARREGTQVAVAVRDTGMGIPAEMLPKVFDLFTQSDRTYSRAQGGLGIGLTLVRSLVEMHGGSVTAASEGSGRGSEFVVRLPLATDEAEPQSPAADGARRRGAAPRRVLVVDDNVDAADSLRRVLHLLGIEVHTAHDGPTGLEALRRHRPSVVILDIGMPGMDGYEFARLARRRPEGRDVLLVALTGWGQADDRSRSKDAGIDRHLVKPVGLDDLMTTLTESSGDTGV